MTECEKWERRDSALSELKEDAKQIFTAGFLAGLLAWAIFVII